MTRRLLLLAALVLLTACAATPEQLAAEREANASAALRDMLAINIDTAAARLSRPGGYLRGGRVRIGFPDALNQVGFALHAAGHEALIEDFVEDINVAAEIAAGRSAPLLKQSLATLVIHDATVTVAGDDTAAMRAFRAHSEAAMLAGHQPAIHDALRRGGAYDSERALFDAYYALPGTTKILFDLELYVRGRAVDGLYVAIGDDERQVRTEPTRWTTPALKTVFGGTR